MNYIMALIVELLCGFVLVFQVYYIIQHHTVFWALVPAAGLVLIVYFVVQIILMELELKILRRNK